MLSQNQPTSIATGRSRKSEISPTEHAALFTIINKARLLNGWTTRTAKELDQTIRAWFEILAVYQIPIAAYPELYQLAFDRRQERLRDKGDVIQMDATLLVSCWTGEYGLKVQLREREIHRRRTPPANAETVCKYCHGTGYRKLRPGERGYDAAYDINTRCDHRELAV